jgi:ABC-type Fe3+/spermidine/putrescine transport system ATPase subunit
VTLTYPAAAQPALRDIHLILPSGQITALVGPSGCGKSTLLRVIAGLAMPDAGDVCFDGKGMAGIAAEARGAVMVAQGGMLFPHMTVAENVGFGLRMRGVPRGAVAQQVDAMLVQVQLAGFGARRPAALSGGQAQRVALARALIVAPRVLLLDEPLSSLDPHLRDEMRDLIMTLQRATGITTLIVTHDRAEATAMAHQMALMLAGEIRQTGVPEMLYARPADADVARFFGAATLLGGEVQGGRFVGPLGQLSVPQGAKPGAGHLVLRPEAVQPGTGENERAAVVQARVFLGAQVRLTLRVDEATLVADWSPAQAAGLWPGDSITVHLPRDGLWVV